MMEMTELELLDRMDDTLQKLNECINTMKRVNEMLEKINDKS